MLQLEGLDGESSIVTGDQFWIFFRVRVCVLAWSADDLSETRVAVCCEVVQFGRRGKRCSLGPSIDRPGEHRSASDDAGPRHVSSDVMAMQPLYA